MADKKEIKFSIDKQKALKIAKKAATEKVAMVKDEGFIFKVGTPSVPPMIAVVEVTDGVIYVSGKGFGATIAQTVYQLISQAIEEAQENSNSNSSASNASQQSSSALSAEEQLKIVEALKGYKDLLDSGIITQEEFDAKKKELLGAKSQQAEAVPSSIESNQEAVIEQEPQKTNLGLAKELNDTPINNEITSSSNQQIIQPSENNKVNRSFNIVIMVFQWVSFLLSLMWLIIYIQGRLEYIFEYQPYLIGFSIGVILCLGYGIILAINNFKKTTTNQSKKTKALVMRIICIFICLAYLALIIGFGMPVVFYGVSRVAFIINDIFLLVPFILMFAKNMGKR